MDAPRFEITTRDLMAGWDERSFDRVGPPIGILSQRASRSEHAAIVREGRWTLTELSAHYVLFAPGLLYTSLRLARDPLAEFTSQQNQADRDTRPVAVECVQPLFQGLGVISIGSEVLDLDRTIFAIPRGHWPALFATLTGLAVLDLSTKFYARVASAEMQIVDILRLRQMAVVDKVPVVDITVFAVSATDGFYYLKPPSHTSTVATQAKAAPRRDLLLEAEQFTKWGE